MMETDLGKCNSPCNEYIDERRGQAALYDILSLSAISLEEENVRTRQLLMNIIDTVKKLI